MDRIIWMKGGGLGDFVVGLPVLAALRRAFPSARIEAVGPPAWLRLTRGWCDSTSAIDGLEWLFLFSASVAPPKRLKNADLAIVLRNDAEGQLAAALSRAGVRRVVLHPPRPEGAGTHVVDHLLQVLTPLGLSGESRPRVLHPNCDEPRLHGRVLIHPGAGGEGKCWPRERFSLLARALSERGWKPEILLGPAEVERGTLPFWEMAGFPVQREPDLWSLAGELATAGLYVGNDTGVSHLAAAVGCPCVVLFGPTVESVWKPRGPLVRVISGEVRENKTISAQTDGPMVAITVPRVMDAIASFRA